MTDYKYDERGRRQGFTFCNPAYYATDSPALTNEQYISTIPDDDPWKPIIIAGAERLDRYYPGWTISQIKEKFGECRFYASPPEGAPWPRGFQEILTEIERACDAVSSTQP